MKLAHCKKRQLSRGFTLVEILVVIAIIAVIAGVSLVALNKVLLGGFKRITLTRIEKLELAVASYEAESESNRLVNFASDLDGSITSSQVLYRILSGDAGISSSVGTLDGTPDGNLLTSSTEDYLREASFLAELLPVRNAEGNLDFLSEETWVKPVDGDSGRITNLDAATDILPSNYAIVDGYGNALRVFYDTAGTESDTSDDILYIWSPGEDGLTSEATEELAIDPNEASDETKDDVRGW